MSAPWLAALGRAAVDPVDADDVAELPGAAGRDAGQRVLEDGGLRRATPASCGAGQEGVGCRLAGHAAARRSVTPSMRPST